MSQPAGRPTLPDIRHRQRLVRQITGCWRTQALHAAVLLDIPDRLARGNGEIAELATVCQCPADSLMRLLRALCTLKVCRQRRDGRFELTAAGDALRRSPADGADSLRALTLWWGGAMWSLWSDLAYSVQTGHSARARQTGVAHYGFLDQQPDTAPVFHQAMQAMTGLIAQELAHWPAWHNTRALVDVGGGHGTLAAAIALAHPRLQVSVLDREDARPAPDSDYGRLMQSGRARFCPGDFFQAVPAGADRYLLKSILHNWDDTQAACILGVCAAAARPGARLLLVERVRPERLRATVHDEALTRTDLNMLAGLGGRERSLAEFSALLEAAGFRLDQVAPTRHEFSVIEAIRL